MCYVNCDGEYRGARGFLFRLNELQIMYLRVLLWVTMKEVIVRVLNLFLQPLPKQHVPTTYLNVWLILV